MKTPLTLPGLLLCIAATGCAGTGVSPSPGTAANSQEPPPADRDAILAMAGEFSVTFAFDETVPLSPGYERREPKRSGAAEAVIVVEDEPGHIVLQHLLLAGDQVIKHWRQDWTWEAESRLEFVDDQTWKRTALAPEDTRGRWTQCVYEVSDAPRYCGTGSWNHRYGNPTWTSDRSWRPLPRREYTAREDYNALNVENRHTVTPRGWTHEQDNSKVQRVGGATRAVLVREFGFNEYQRTDAIDFSPVYRYWQTHADYWARVRATWQRQFDEGGVILDTDVDGMPIIEGLFALAETAAERNAEETQAEIDRVFRAYTASLATDQGLNVVSR